MKPSKVISSAATQSANDSHRTNPGPTRTTYVFVFVPVYIDKKSDATVRPTTPGPLAKFRRLFFRQDRHLQPFWTWFIDNPRPPIAEMKTMLQSIRIYIVITLLTGIVYPLAMTGVVQILFLLDQVQQP